MNVDHIIYAALAIILAGNIVWGFIDLLRRRAGKGILPMADGDLERRIWKSEIERATE